MILPLKEQILRRNLIHLIASETATHWKLFPQKNVTAAGDARYSATDMKLKFIRFYFRQNSRDKKRNTVSRIGKTQKL